MVKTVTSLGRSGLHDWLVQRVSAVILAAYCLFLLGYLLIQQPLGFEQWRTLFGCFWMKLFTLLGLLSLSLHAWVGVWTVITDYIKPLGLRLLVQVAVILTCVAYFFWGVAIIWSV